ncbi:MAG: ribulose-phosphate 3-epimerase [Patescibacteria group bacterium]
MITVLPAILEKDVATIQQRVNAVVGLAPEIHLDIMDGEFVPNVTVNDPAILEQIDWKGLRVSLHLMIRHPELSIRRWAQSMVSSIVVHREAVNNMDNIIELIHGLDKQCGVALNPHTPSYDVIDYLEKLDLVMIMGVEPGFAAQGFNSDVLEKIKYLHTQKPNLPIAVDGGVNDQSKPSIVKAGANILCANSYLFKANDIATAYASLR